MAESRKIDHLLADYGSYHRARGNLVCHAFGISLIVFGIFSLLGTVRLPMAGWTAAEALLALSFLFYLSLDAALAIGVLFTAGLLDLAARRAGDWRIGLAAFALGWVLQAVGHARFERNSPAFFKNLVHLMIGPAFLVNEALKLRPSPLSPLPPGEGNQM